MEAKPNYRVNKNDIPIREIKPKAAANDSIRMRTQKVFGSQTSLMFADRASGYHTKPHRHDAEQFNYIVSGEIWFFVDGRGYRCKPGDIMRIPRNKVHWAWNRGDNNVVVIESHTPSLVGDEHASQKAVGLIGPDEDPKSFLHAINSVVAMSDAEVDAIEKRAIAEEG